MDIVKRAYLKICEEIEGTMPDDEVIWFQQKVKDEVIRLIKERAYSGRDWPREFGSIPDEIRSKRRLRDLKKIKNCTKCDLANPPFTIALTREFEIHEAEMPDKREYALICLNCHRAIEHISIDNTLVAIKKMRDELDDMYGVSYLVPELM